MALKRVGIITFHSADNFGAVLQSYALMKTVENLGFYSEIIDFRPEGIVSQYKLFGGSFKKKYLSSGLYKIIRFYIKCILNSGKVLKRIRNFKSFRKDHFRLSDKVYHSSDELMKEKPLYDYYITGSDQVWNPDFFINVGASYFLDFAVEGAKRISYAASIVKKLNTNESKYFKTYLKRFDNISIREKSSLEAVQNLTDKEVHVVLDPTLLLEGDDWSSISTFSVHEASYILVYDLIKDPIIVYAANKISGDNNLKIINYSGEKGYNNWHSSFATTNPTEFSGLIKNAKFVVTNSFHGTIFSIIFKKQFYTIPYPGRGSRMIDLLNELGLKERIVESIDDNISIDQMIDYEKVYRRLDTLKEESKSFLQEALGLIKK